MQTRCVGHFRRIIFSNNDSPDDHNNSCDKPKGAKTQTETNNFSVIRVCSEIIASCFDVCDDLCDEFWRADVFDPDFLICISEISKFVFIERKDNAVFGGHRNFFVVIFGTVW